MHYAIKDFSHARIGGLWPRARDLDIVIDQTLERAAFDDVTDYQDALDVNAQPLDSELRWFRGVCRNGAEGYFGGPDDLDPPRRRIFGALESALLKSRFKVQPGNWQHYFARLPRASPEVHTAMTAAAAPILDEESSIAICNVMKSIDIAKILKMKSLHALRRANVEVVLNGVTPTPFTRQLSPFNVWLMHVMLSFPNVSYRQGKLSKVDRQPDGRYRVRFGKTDEETFDRVVTRYGPSGGPRLAQSRSALEPAGYLLTLPEVAISGRYVDLAKEEIEQARRRLARRRPSRAPEHQIDRTLYAMANEIPKKHWPNSILSGRHSQAVLVQMMKDGVRPKFSSFERL